MENMIAAIGTPSFVARIAGVSLPSVLGWRGRVPVNRCPSIERGTAGLWTVEKLRPDACWVRINDAQWPWHPQGRPLLDVTGESSSGDSSAA